MVKLKDLMPVFILFLLIAILTVILQFIRDTWTLPSIMRDFMGLFFVIFGGFKVYNLYGFVEAYRMYDIIAKRSIIYAYCYPFIELTLGICYLFGILLTPVLIFTIILMLISSIGVIQVLRSKQEFVCACLGAVFKIPMTYVTLTEDLLMAAMALIMLIM